MKKIGILTLPGNFNYGNRLQNYALQFILEQRGYDVDTLNIPFSRKKRLKKLLDGLSRFLVSPSLFKKFFEKREYGKEFSEMAKVKSPKLLPFTEKNIKNRNISKEEIESIASEYDFFITGSDQVWNQSSMSDSTYFLDFVPYDKRYSYAASFGKTNILKADIKYYKKNISNMKKISVREIQGKQIVEKLTNKDVIVNVDPTMLLTDNHWRDVARQDDRGWLPKKKFILVYSLRGINDSKNKELNEFAEKKGYEILTIMGDNISSNNVILTVPQFLQAIDKAVFVLTDSFHGTVFSIIFKTPFQVLERKTGNMNSRLDNLLEKFDLKDNSTKINRPISDLINTDFSKVSEILEHERHKTKLYFDSFLGIYNG